jgi:hypothetical protein
VIECLLSRHEALSSNTNKKKKKKKGEPERREDQVSIEAEIGEVPFEDGGRVHKPRIQVASS